MINTTEIKNDPLDMVDGLLTIPQPAGVVNYDFSAIYQYCNKEKKSIRALSVYEFKQFEIAR